jgi:hypothetical protein
MDGRMLRQLAEVFREEADRNEGMVDRTPNILRRISDKLFELAEPSFEVGGRVTAAQRIGGGLRNEVEAGTEGTILGMAGGCFVIEFDGHPIPWEVGITEIEWA